LIAILSFFIYQLFIAEESYTITNEAKNHKVIFAGISRDNYPDLKEVTKLIENIGINFVDYRVVIFENDSTDGTKLFLDKWAKNNKKVKIISEDFNIKKRPNIQFLADARNKYLDYIFTNSEYIDFDLIIVMDMDMSYGLSINGVWNSISQMHDKEVICANGIMRSNKRMYDAFAFRDKDFPFGPHEIGADGYWTKIRYELQKYYNPNDGLKEVYSCFGGMAIYKKNSLENCRYSSVKNDCEHVYLHKCMREKNNAKVYLNPKLVLKYPY
jgi:MoaA/NifB/PqqE/SkfB family radical SAM enzyme